MSRKFGLTKPRREPLRRKQITMKPQQIKDEVEKGCEIKPKNVIGMTRKEYEYFKEGVETGRKQNLDFTDGFREGRLYEREKIEKIIDDWASRSILTFDDYSIKQKQIIEDITKYVKELKLLLSQLEDDEVKGK